MFIFVCDIDSGVELSHHVKLLDLPAEFSRKSNEEILAFLRERQRPSSPPAADNISRSNSICASAPVPALVSGAVEVYRIKVLVVGPGEAGKTTLMHRLITGEFPKEPFPMTDGISLQHWRAEQQLQGGDGTAAVKKVQFMLWDFGGQPVYMNTHPMLFTDEALYLVLCNPRTGENVAAAGGTAGLKGQLEGYLHTIRCCNRSAYNTSSSSAGSSSDKLVAPVMLVSTRADDVQPVADDVRFYLEQQLGAPFAAYHQIDSLTGTGIDQLKADMVRISMDQPYVRQLLPSKYVLLEQEVELRAQRGEFTVTMSQFGEMVAAVGLAQDPHQQLALSLFHQWGVVHQLPRAAATVATATSADGTDPDSKTASSCTSDVVLKPQKLADVLSCVVSASISRPGQDVYKNGLLPHSELHKVWGGYEPRLWPQFLSLLYGCNLAFPLFDSDGTAMKQSLVPAMLPHHPQLGRNPEKPLLEAFFSAEHWRLNQCSVATVEVQMDLLPTQLFPRFLSVVRNMTIADCIWRNCCVLYVADDHSAVVDAGVGVEWSGAVSMAVVVEDVQHNTLRLLPVGANYMACSYALRRLRDVRDLYFSGLAFRNVYIDGANEKFVQSKILDNLEKNIDTVVHIEERNFPLRCLCSLFDAFNEVSPDDSFAAVRLALNRYKKDPTNFNRAALGEALRSRRSLFTERLLGVRSDDVRELWLARSATSAAANDAVASEDAVTVMAVSPSTKPGGHWFLMSQFPLDQRHVYLQHQHRAANLAAVGLSDNDADDVSVEKLLWSCLSVLGVDLSVGVAPASAGKMVRVSDAGRRAMSELEVWGFNDISAISTANASFSSADYAMPQLQQLLVLMKQEIIESIKEHVSDGVSTLVAGQQMISAEVAEVQQGVQQVALSIDALAMTLQQTASDLTLSLRASLEEMNSNKDLLFKIGASITDDLNSAIEKYNYKKTAAAEQKLLNAVSAALEEVTEMLQRQWRSDSSGLRESLMSAVQQCTESVLKQQQSNSNSSELAELSAGVAEIGSAVKTSLTEMQRMQDHQQQIQALVAVDNNKKLLEDIHFCVSNDVKSAMEKHNREQTAATERQLRKEIADMLQEVQGMLVESGSSEVLHGALMAAVQQCTEAVQKQGSTLEGLTTGVTQVGCEVVIAQEQMQQVQQLQLQMHADVEMKLNANFNVMRRLMQGNCKVPTLCLLQPRSSSSSLLGRVRGLFTKEMTLVFVCPVTMRPVLPCGPPTKRPHHQRMGYVVKMTRAWVQKLAPLLKLTLQVARAALAAYGIPLPLSLPASLLDGAADGATACMERMHNELEEICNAEASLVNQLQQHEGKQDESKVLNAAHSDMWTLLRQLEDSSSAGEGWVPKYTGLQQAVCRMDGSHAWVSPEQHQPYEAEGAQLLMTNRVLERVVQLC